MRRVRLDETAREHLRGVYDFTRERWGDTQAETYIRSLSARFDDIARRTASSQPVAAIFEVEGFYCRCEAHFIYWRPIDAETVAIVAILHRQMHQPDRVRLAFEASL